MNNPKAKKYLKHAAKLRISTLKVGKTPRLELMAIANYYRLAGELIGPTFILSAPMKCRAM
ncbi:MAG: hypothetical protein R2911_06030 [Caldilineaceae bacterium]